jgi:hypothetical protein
MEQWRMEQVEVGITKLGMIRIEQSDSSLGDDPSIVVLHPSQIDVVCQWLKEARDEVLKLFKEGTLPEK